MTNTAFSADDQALLAEIEPDSFWFKHRNDVISALVRRFPPTGRIFDIGGGNGYVSLGLKHAGFDCVVIEPSEAGAANAAHRGLPVVQRSLESITDSQNSIQAAGMFDVLEHIEDDSTALANLHRALTPGGRLYLSVPAYQALWSSEDVEAGHFRRYTLGGLRRMFVSAGFSMEYATYFFAPLVIPLFVIRTLSRRKVAKTGAEIAADHTLPSGLVGNVLARALRCELRMISRGRTVPSGTSCLVVARKSAA